jgi:hypothetical protein
MTQPNTITTDLKAIADPDDLTALRAELDAAQKGHCRFAWWALVGLIEAIKERKERKAKEPTK